MCYVVSRAFCFPLRSCISGPLLPSHHGFPSGRHERRWSFIGLVCFFTTACSLCWIQSDCRPAGLANGEPGGWASVEAILRCPACLLGCDCERVGLV